MNWYTLLGIHPTVYLNVYQYSPDLAGCSRTITDTKKPAGLVPCGLSVLHRTYPDHDLGWRLCALGFILLIFNI
ncbi:hypothetical protein AAT96_07080 [Salmonella enterica subsp. enterica]|nr:hypothetical protein [Salmonella enterica subsp. enterica]